MNYYYLATVSFRRYFMGNKQFTVTELVYAPSKEKAKELVYEEYNKRFPVDEFDGDRDISELYVSIQDTIGLPQ
jgi:hypothetical protein